MSILIMEDSLRLTVFFVRSAPRPESICLYLEESSLDEGERLLRAEEAGLHLTPGQARALADELLQALRERERELDGSGGVHPRGSFSDPDQPLEKEA